MYTFLVYYEKQVICKLINGGVAHICNSTGVDVTDSFPKISAKWTEKSH